MNRHKGCNYSGATIPTQPEYWFCNKCGQSGPTAEGEAGETTSIDRKDQS